MKMNRSRVCLACLAAKEVPRGIYMAMVSSSHQRLQAQPIPVSLML